MLYMPVIPLLLLILLLPALPVYGKDCSTCHPMPQDSSHAAHAALKLREVSYGDTGITSKYHQRSDVYSYNCGNCHPQDTELHGNGAIDVDLSPDTDGNGLKRLNSSDASYNKATKTCRGIYCHSSGERKGNIEYRETPVWGTTFDAFRCQACHGSPPPYKNEPGRENSHFNAQTPAAHLLGIHWDSTRGHTKESFTNRQSSDMGCSTCHYGTVADDRDTTFVDKTSGLFTCSRCHDDKKVLGKNRTGVITNKALHVNGIVEVVFKPEKFRTTARLMQVPEGWTRKGEFGDPHGYDETVQELNSAHYLPDGKKCLDIACHLSGKEVRWGESLTCASCHRDLLRKQ